MASGGGRQNGYGAGEAAFWLLVFPMVGLEGCVCVVSLCVQGPWTKWPLCACNVPGDKVMSLGV